VVNALRGASKVGARERSQYELRHAHVIRRLGRLWGCATGDREASPAGHSRRSTDQRGFTRSTCPCMLYSRSSAPQALATRGRARIGWSTQQVGEIRQGAHHRQKSARWSVFSAVVWALRIRAEPAPAASREPPLPHTHARQAQRCCTLVVYAAPMQRQHGDRKRKRPGDEEEASGALKASRPSLPQRGTMPHKAAKPRDAGGATASHDDVRSWVYSGTPNDPAGSAVGSAVGSAATTGSDCNSVGAPPFSGSGSVGLVPLAGCCVFSGDGGGSSPSCC
jgi:hypothetical protein